MPDLLVPSRPVARASVPARSSMPPSVPRPSQAPHGRYPHVPNHAIAQAPMSALTPLSEAIEHVPRPTLGHAGQPARAELPGVMMTPASPRGGRTVSFAHERAPAVVNQRHGEDQGSVMGAFVVLGVAAATFGVALDRLGSGAGWPLVRFFMGPDWPWLTPVQYGTAALLAVVGLQNGRRAHRSWTGSGGGVLSAVVTAALTGLSIFAAWELFCAA